MTMGSYDSAMMLLFIVKGHPVIDGVLDVSNVTFACFFNLSDCSNYGVYAIGNNPLSLMLFTHATD